MPPVRSGIADYTRDLVAALTGAAEIDVFVASTDEVDTAHETGAPARYATAHDFPWRHHRAPYDLTIFQMGNSWCHDFMWPYLFRYPGLVVLHDGHLHHARAWSLLRRGRSDDYRAELAFNHPELPREAAEAALAGLGGTLYYFWPMLRSVVTSARAVAVHSEALADEIAAIRRTPGAKSGEAGVYGSGHLICRPTRKEAEEYYHYIVYDMGDWEAAEHAAAIRTKGRSTPLATLQRLKERLISGLGTYPVVGSYDDAAEAFKWMSDAGLNGMAIGLVNYIKDFPALRDEVLPRMARLGLREPHKAKSHPAMAQQQLGATA